MEDLYTMPTMKADNKETGRGVVDENFIETRWGTRARTTLTTSASPKTQHWID